MNLATVITSLASALPVVGTSIVGWLWGGFSVSYRQLDYCLENSAFCGNNFFICDYHLLEEFYCKKNKNNLILFNMIGMVKTPQIYSQSADVWTSKIIKTYSTLPASQRLNAEEQAWLVGFYEADGWFGIFKNGKYVQYEFGIELHKRDTPLLYQVKNLYKLSGNIRTLKDRTNMVVFKVRNKKNLITKIVPIFEKYPILGAKKEQFSLFKYHLVEKNTVYSQELNLDYKKYSFFVNNLFSLHKMVEDLMKASYFDFWLVGFINGKGCFSVYTAQKEKNPTCSFEIGQTVDGLLLLSAIQKRLALKANVFFCKKTKHYRLKTTSVSGCANVLKFLHNAKVSLKGHKRIQYIQWAKELRINPRYASIKVPNKL